MKTDSRLMGRWKSDAEKTFAGLTEAQLKQFSEVFGKMKFEFTQVTIFSERDSEGDIDSVRYSILESDLHSVLIRVHAPIEAIESMSVGGPYDARLHFEGESVYWVEISPCGVKEYFSRCS